MDTLGKKKAIWAALLTSLIANAAFALIPNPSWVLASRVHSWSLFWRPTDHHLCHVYERV